MLNGDTRTSKKYLAFVAFLDERLDRGESGDKRETLIPLRAEIMIP